MQKLNRHSRHTPGPVLRQAPRFLNSRFAAAQQNDCSYHHVIARNEAILETAVMNNSSNNPDNDDYQSLEGCFVPRNDGLDNYVIEMRECDKQNEARKMRPSEQAGGTATASALTSTACCAAASFLCGTFFGGQRKYHPQKVRKLLPFLTEY